ncbi:MAG: small conductance mechanosensitive channel [Pseudohongiellaceae bacterium]|jgi:small conductance mechanosensitive channel|tara:strand:+ start:407 stop:1234 length:828 start_codon:yes stop_codon:yes gene_type:complete
MDEELQQAQEVYNLIVQFLVTYSFQIVGAIIVLILGIVVGNKLSGFIENFMVRKKLDVTLSHFAAGAIKILIIAFTAIIALGKVGISVTPFVAAIGALALGAGLALQGLLSNYAAGVSIIITRPFVVGDTISVQGVTGVVREVKLAYTILTNEDDVTIIIPNKHIVGEIIHNSNANSVVEVTVGIAYSSDPDQAIAVIRQAITSTPGVVASKDPQVGIDNYGDSSIDIGLRFWVPTQALFETKYQTNLAVFKALAENDIEIPFPQRHVHLINQGE